MDIPKTRALPGEGELTAHLFSLRCTADMRDEVRAWAAAEGVATSDLLRHLIGECLARRASEDTGGE